MAVLHWPKSVQLEASPEDSWQQLSNIQGCYNTASQLGESVTKHTTMLRPVGSEATALQHFKTGFQVERERFLPTCLTGGSADVSVLTKHLLRGSSMVQSCSFWVIAASKSATTPSFRCNDPNYCRADRTPGLLDHIPSHTSTSAGDRPFPPPGNSQVPEAEIKPGRFFLTVEEETLTTCLKRSACLLGTLLPS